MLLGLLVAGCALGSGSRPDQTALGVLAEACFACHGPDEASREAELRLDRVGLRELKDKNSPLLLGDSPELLARVESPDPNVRMPPPEAKHELAPAEIELLRSWLDAGAPVEEHWSFRPLEPGTLGIDGTLQQHALENGLELAPPASKETWLRRASFVLTGLPPTVQELDGFLERTGPEAFVEEVNRLLASPRFGERMAADWLDVARYADTYGYQSDVERAVWPWRDWVVRAFNNGMGYDAFVRAQLAGDLLPEADQESRLATAFQRLHRQTNEGGSVEEEYRLEYVGDRTHTFGTAFLGLTLECARCHDHKFDPIGQDEYYALSSLFANIDESGLYSHFTNATPTPAMTLVNDAQRDKLARLEEAVRSADPMSPAATQLEGWYPLHEVGEDGQLENHVEGAPAGKAHRELRVEDHGLLFNGDAPATFPQVGVRRRYEPLAYSLWLRVPERFERAVVLHRSKAWHDSGSRGYQLLVEEGRLSVSWIHFWPGDALRVRALEEVPVGDWAHVAVSYDGSSRAAGVTLWLNGRRLETEVVRDSLTRKIIDGAESHLTLGERFRDKGLRGGSVRGLAVFDGEIDQGIVRLLASDGLDLEELSSALAGVEKSSRAEGVQAARGALAQALDALPQIMVMAEMDEPRPTYLLERGSYLTPGQRVAPGAPAALPEWPSGAPRNRLGLTQWLLGPAQSMTARVAVNRLWQQVFGSGLVVTSEDFGVQGTPPSHPGLLDQLAQEYVDSGWDTKALLRRLVLSDAFRRSSIAAGDGQDLDPANRLLARGPLGRLSAEMLRDNALALGGLLVEQLGGPPVRPYQPPGLWKEVSGRTYVQGSGAALYRRSLYTIWKRTAPPPSMELLDAAKRDVCVTRRQSTSTPLQALVLWNDPQFVEAARGFAQRMLLEVQGDAERLVWAFREATSRRPVAAEQEALVRLLGDFRRDYGDDPQAAKDLLSVGESSPHADLDPAELAAWTCVLQTLLASDASVVLR